MGFALEQQPHRPVRPRPPPARGEVVKVGVDTAHLHLFDADSGLRVGD